MRDYSFAEYIKKLRLEAGYTQGRVAEICGYGSSQFISNWERGLSYPPIETLIILSEVYGVPAKDLYVQLEISMIARMKSTLRKEFESHQV